MSDEVAHHQIIESLLLIVAFLDKQVFRHCVSALVFENLYLVPVLHRRFQVLLIQQVVGVFVVNLQERNVHIDVEVHSLVHLVKKRLLIQQIQSGSAG